MSLPEMCLTGYTADHGLVVRMEVRVIVDLESRWVQRIRDLVRRVSWL